jgi:hypothetical protein
MKQYNLSRLTSQVESALVSYLASSLPVGNHQNQSKLGERFLALWNEHTFKGPYIETLPRYQRDSSLSKMAAVLPMSASEHIFFSRMRPLYDWERIDSDPTLKQFQRARRQLWPEGCADAAVETEKNTLQRLWDRKLYSHQRVAFDAVSKGRCNIVVATSTGSGKTECFLLPLLYELLTESDETRLRTGVRAILLYPMNALVEDQMARLRRLLFWINLRASDGRSSSESKLRRQVTFGRYTGETRVNEGDKGPDRSVSPEEVHELGELRYRYEMQQRPPDILVTNFTMLEYMLLRNDDRKLFGEPDLFKFLILDEVHSYRGTTGMEVSTLLSRFRNYLSRTSSSKLTSYVCIGTSATLSSEPDAREKMAQFASRLFGASFPQAGIITGDVHPSDPITDDNSDTTEFVEGLLRLPLSAPTLCRAFGIERLDNDYTDDSDIPSEEWLYLAQLLGVDSIPVRRLLDDHVERTDLLGLLVIASPLFAKFKAACLVHNGLPTTLNELVRTLCPHLFASRKDDCHVAVGRFIQLVQGARSGGEGLLPLRAHLFVREHRNAYLCVNPAHTNDAAKMTDGWWSELFVSHRSACDTCGSFVYPLWLCRKCGFVVIEGWLRTKSSRVFPERDDLMGKDQFKRLLFRPLKALTERTRDRLERDNIPVVTICTHCGLRFPHDRDEYLQAALRQHAERCPPSCLIQAVEWQQQSSGVCLDECPYCDQDWFAGQEVVTPPTLSLYAAATILLEEMKRGIDEPLNGTDFVNKVLCFSDSRQQAAFIASRLQRTNEDFTFRQVMYGVLRDTDAQTSSTRTLVSGISETLVNDITLAKLFCDDDELGDEGLIRKRVATMLFRDTCTEYRTLESLGIVSVLYPDALLTLSNDFLSTQPLTREFRKEERVALTEFILDWTFRFRRWAISPTPLQLSYPDLEKYRYQEKSVSKLAGDQYSRTSGFSLKQENSRNRTLDFYRRLCKRQTRLRFAGDLLSYKMLMESWWESVMAHPEMSFRQKQGMPPPEDKPFLVIGGTDSDTLQLKLSWASLRWQLEQDSIDRYRCDSCGYITRNDILHLCPVRDCSGTLKRTTVAEMCREPFSPARHYLALLKTKAPKPLNIEEHTAQISPVARREIEESFRSDEKGSTDIISGSTTFELGIDLGTVSAVFLANMPPEVSNYRQRAGRAGRRTGMLPLVVTYVRERPHDSYFWSNPDYFIAGPLKVPRFSAASHEVLLRHVNATVFSYLMQTYPTTTGLQGPSVNDFLEFATNPVRESNLRRHATNSSSDLWTSLKSLLDTNRSVVMTPEESLDHFFKRLRHFQQVYSTMVSGDGTINTLSDYGILPSYNYPIYVDELRLYEYPRTESPRKDLKLQRDRSISLNEYFPGRIVVAGKHPIRSIGIWNGFKQVPFKYCKECSYVDTRGANQSSASCPNGCGSLVSLSAIRPLGGFIGELEKGLARQDPDLFAVARSQFLFDPAGNPPPPLTSSGRALNAARQTSFNVEKSGARMRTFVPRPDSEQSLELTRAMLRDVAMNGTKKSECLVLPTKGNGAREKHFLMHEFTTDILRLQIRDNAVGKTLLSATAYQQAATSADEGERKRGNTIWLYTLVQALATGGARLLQIDPREIATTFRCAPTDALLRHEAILFDTAPGGAGYCDQLFGDLKGLFEMAIAVLDCGEGCGDSCYSCLRSFDNQAVHSRLNRFFVLDGLKSFAKANWS